MSLFHYVIKTIPSVFKYRYTPSFSVYPVHVVCSSSSWGEPERVWTTLVCGLCMGLALCMYVCTSVGGHVMCGVRWVAGLFSAIYIPQKQAEM